MNTFLACLIFLAGMIAGGMMASDESSLWKIIILYIALAVVAMIVLVGRDMCAASPHSVKE